MSKINYLRHENKVNEYKVLSYCEAVGAIVTSSVTFYLYLHMIGCNITPVSNSDKVYVTT